MTRLLIIALCVVTMTLSGCRAMYTHDLDASPYHNEWGRDFYAREKEASVNLINSYSYRYRSGDLIGHCRQVPETFLKKSASGTVKALERTPGDLIVDTVSISATPYFQTDKSTLTQQGTQALDDLLTRIGRYDDVKLIAITGFTDSRHTVAYNQSLSERRSQTVFEYLKHTHPKVERLTKSLGELAPVATNDTAPGRQLNRHVEVQVIAKDVNLKNADNTLCQKELRGYQKTYFETSPADGIAERRVASLTTPIPAEMPLSVGDRVSVRIPEGEEFSGIFEISIGGTLQIPHVGGLQVNGFTPDNIQTLVADQMVEKELFRAHTISVSVTVQQWAPIDVFVSGATFAPGRVTINHQRPDQLNFKQTQVSGDGGRDRLLTTALQAAGGIRPDADIRNIQVIRGGRTFEVDLSGVFDGRTASDFALASGDQVVVPSVGFFQKDLVRPTQMTPPGIRVFMSNLTTPASSNSLSAIGNDATKVPYGTRFLRGVVSSNCVGGTQMTNAARRAVLISTNPLTGKTEVIERSIQQLVSDPDRDDINPFLMPNDGIACYDSSVTNMRDIAKTFSDLLNPFVSYADIIRAR